MGHSGGTRILGIDPGSLIVGFGCLEVRTVVVPNATRRSRPLALSATNAVGAAPRGGRITLVDAGCIELGGRRVALEDRLVRLRARLIGVLDTLDADELALEEAFYGKSVSAALRIGEARGVILATARAHGLEVHQFAPARIKRAVAGHGGASKEAVAAMLRQQIEVGSIPRRADVTDALAAAFCRAQESGMG